MSVEHRSSQTPSEDRATEDDRSADTDTRSTGQPSTPRSGVELEYHSPVNLHRTQSTARQSQATTVGSRPTSSITTDASDAPLSHRIERTKLQTRVSALERALETSESRQHEIVTQYERLLAERTADADADLVGQQRRSADNGTGDDGLLMRLLERWR